METCSKLRPIRIMATLALALVFGLTFTMSARADTAHLEFTIGSGGSISYGGPGTDLVGSNIPVTQVTGIRGSNNGVTLDIIDGFLNFYWSEYQGSKYNWIFYPYLYFEITGTTSPLHGSGSLAVGDFYKGFVDKRSDDEFTITGITKGVRGLYVNNIELASFYGMLPIVGKYGRGGVGGLEIDFLGVGSPGEGSPLGAFTSTQVLGGRVIVYGTPLPSSVILLSFGLLSLALGPRFMKS